jgi:hypothetical protein
VRQIVLVNHSREEIEVARESPVAKKKAMEFGTQSAIATQSVAVIGWGY